MREASQPHTDLSRKDGRSRQTASRDELDRIVLSSLRPVSLGLSVFYLIVAVSDALLLPPFAAARMAVIGGCTAVLLAGLYVLLVYRPVRTAWAHPILAGIAGLVLLNSLTHLYLLAQPLQTTNISLLIVACGCLVLSRYWLGLVLLTSLGAWLVLVILLPPSPEWRHYGFVLVSATVIAALTHIVRLRNVRTLEEMHLRDIARTLELEAAYAAERTAHEELELKVKERTLELSVANARLNEQLAERGQTANSLRELKHRAIAEYEALLQRLTHLAQLLGSARDLVSVFRALRDFATASTPCNGLFVSLYDPRKQLRTAAYAWSEDQEIDVSSIPSMRMTGSPQARAVETGQVVITDDFQSAMEDKPVFHVSMDVNPRLPRSSLVAPMAVMGRVVGAIEVQSAYIASFTPGHATAMRMAANLAAIAVENVRLLEGERKARALAEQTNRAKDQFLATLSHELRTPLTSMLGWITLLRTGRLEEATHDRVFETIERNARSQKQLIDELLDVSRIITGKFNMELRPVSLSGVVRAAIETLKPTAAARSVTVTLKPLKENVRDIMVPGDPDRLQQVAWNLLSNAIKFTPEGGEVKIRLEVDRSWVRMIVQDTGCGISSDFLPYVFERFRQADSTPTRKHSGLGLGLAIVRHMVEMHGGSVAAESGGAGQGSTFTATLPLMMAGLKSGKGARAPSDSQKQPGPKSLLKLTGVRILVVDDEEDTLNFVNALLDGSGAEVRTAISTREGFRILDRWKPDVVISDIGMPEENGYSFIRKVRGRVPEDGGSVPAIALTAYATEEDRFEAFRAGYQVHMPKPVEPDDLIIAVAGLACGDGKDSAGNEVRHQAVRSD